MKTHDTTTRRAARASSTNAMTTALPGLPGVPYQANRAETEETTMQSNIKSKKTMRMQPGTVIAFLALFVALTGSAFAASVAKKNSVDSKSIKDNAVASTDVQDNGLTGTDVDESTLGPVPRATLATTVGPNSIGTDEIAPNGVTNTDIADGAVTGVKLGLSSVDQSKIQNDSVVSSKIPDYAVGASELDYDSVGADELKGLFTVTSQGVQVNAGTAKSTSVQCPLGSQIVSGGFAWQEDEANSIIGSSPSQTTPTRTWEVRGMVDSGSNVLYAWASCIQA